MITARVSHLAAYADWKAEEQMDLDWIVNRIQDSKPTEAMAKGTAFHKFLEHQRAVDAMIDTAEVDGYTFAFTGDFNLYLPAMREWRKGKDYGGITVSGQCDAIEGKTIYDHKTTERFDAERYLDGWQWKFYLDIFGADRFVWNVWDMKYLGEVLTEDRQLQSYEVRDLHKIQQYRYPAMTDDCTELALEYKEFAEKHLPTG